MSSFVSPSKLRVNLIPNRLPNFRTTRRTRATMSLARGVLRKKRRHSSRREKPSWIAATLKRSQRIALVTRCGRYLGNNAQLHRALPCKADELSEHRLY